MDLFSRFTWIIFLVHKDEACKAFKVFSKGVQNEKDFCISPVRSYHSGVFENYVFEKICNQNVISHNFFSLRTPQQNGIVERKNISLQEMARTMLLESGLLKDFGQKQLTLPATFKIMFS